MLKLKLFMKPRNSSQLGSSSTSCIQSGFPTLYQSIKRMEKYDVMSISGILIKHAPKMNFHFQTWICSLTQLPDMLCFHSWMVSAVTIRSKCYPKIAKIAFQTPIGNFYYTAMPFSLKNAEDTYKKGHDRNLS